MTKTKFQDFISTIVDKYRSQIEELVEGKEKYKTEYYEELVQNKAYKLLNQFNNHHSPYALGAVYPGYGTNSGDTTMEKLGWTYLDENEKPHFYKLTEQGREIVDDYIKILEE